MKGGSDSRLEECKNVLKSDGREACTVCECLSEKCPTPVIRIGINDEFGRSGPAKELLSYYKLDAASIADRVKKALNK